MKITVASSDVSGIGDKPLLERRHPMEILPLYELDIVCCCHTNMPFREALLLETFRITSNSVLSTTLLKTLSV